MKARFTQEVNGVKGDFVRHGLDLQAGQVPVEPFVLRTYVERLDGGEGTHDDSEVVVLHFTDELPEQPYEDSDAEEIDLYAVLGEAIERPSPRQHDVMRLRYCGDLTEVQTAKKLATTVGTVRTTAALRTDEELRHAWSATH